MIHLVALPGRSDRKPMKLLDLEFGNSITVAESLQFDRLTFLPLAPATKMAKPAATFVRWRSLSPTAFDLHFLGGVGSSVAIDYGLLSGLRSLRVLKRDICGYATVR